MSSHSAIPIKPQADSSLSSPSSSSSSSGGGVYGTTPGGTTRILYSRDQLLNLASSPLARSPPKMLANIPELIARSAAGLASPTFSDSSERLANDHTEEHESSPSASANTSRSDDDAHFDMDL
ncbi:hypothetical protein BCV70DRAFT_201244 [Testicularia cyperi]|uniref:Eukaryotic translation initiation factor 4E binding protein n=1 Tax=Testicularia cyperi TaxID=1882483 RepID=A0A317XL25_9BASI|nr:hypothetical protein BCV70DRAFT_201244 [Testicularia cyperi]